MVNGWDKGKAHFGRNKGADETESVTTFVRHRRRGCLPLFTGIGA